MQSSTNESAQQIDSSDGLTPAADLRRWAAKFSGITVYNFGRSMRADAPVEVKL